MNGNRTSEPSNHACLCMVGSVMHMCKYTKYLLTGYCGIVKLRLRSKVVIQIAEGAAQAKCDHHGF